MPRHLLPRIRKISFTKNDEGLNGERTDIKEVGFIFTG